jgi:hypothetical protein
VSSPDDEEKKKNAPQRFDPWAPGNRSRQASFFAVSTLIHVGVLVLLATATVQIVKKVEEIRVKVLDDSIVGTDQPGEPSLNDIAGALKVNRAQPQAAARPAGPRIENVKAPVMPNLAVGPKIGRGPTIDDSLPGVFGAGGGGGLGGLGGMSGAFGEYVGGLRRVGLDVALVIDCTSSMQFAINAVKANLSGLVSTLQRMVPTARLGIVAYRDQGDEFVVKWSDLSFKTAKLTEFIKNLRAEGGGDWEEVLPALTGAINDLSWRKDSKKVIILVSGSPPHPWEVEPTLDLVREFRSQGGVVSTIDVTQPLHEEFDRFMWRSLKGSAPYQPTDMPEHYKQTAVVLGEIAKSGGGEMIALGEQKALVREVLILTFGKRWQQEMAKFAKELS